MEQTQKARDLLPGAPYALGSFPCYVRALLLVKKAAARTNGATGAIAPGAAARIEAACDGLLAEVKASNEGEASNAAELVRTYPPSLLLGGGQIGINLNLCELIALRCRTPDQATIDPKLHVNASQSTADVCATAARLAVLDEVDSLVAAGLALAASFEASAGRFVGIRTRARTCLRDAMLVDASASLRAFGVVIGRRIQGVSRAAAALTSVNLGGTVIGSGDGATDEYRALVLQELSQLSGRTLVHRADLYDAAQHPDDLGELASQIGLFAETLLKVASDIRLLSSGPRAGFGELTTREVMQGSSFFKGKINPTLEESVAQAAMQALGHEHTARLAASRGEAHLNVYEGLTVLNLFLAIHALRPAVRAWASAGVPYFEPNNERCEANLI